MKKTCLVCEKPLAVQKPPYPSPHQRWFCGNFCCTAYAMRMADQYEWCAKHGWHTDSCGLCMVDRLNKKGRR